MDAIAEEAGVDIGIVEELLRPDGEWDDQVMATFCHYVRHFTSVDSALAWTERRDGTFILDLADAVDLAQRHVARTFGEVS